MKQKLVKLIAYLHCAICKIPAHASRCNLVTSSGAQLTSLLGLLTYSLGLVCELGLGIRHRGPSGAVCLLTQLWAQPAFSKTLLNELFGGEKPKSPRGFYFIFSLQKNARAHNPSFTLFLNPKEQTGLQCLPEESQGKLSTVSGSPETVPSHGKHQWLCEASPMFL